jgi:shikimate dehydrogenase
MGQKKMLPDNPVLRAYQHLYGLIGYPLGHSFSQSYFNEKFSREGLSGHYYQAFPLESVSLFPELLETYPNLRGLNVTIPYKEQIIPYLDDIEEGAAQIGAVNVIRCTAGICKGYNSDVHGFEEDLGEFLAGHRREIGAALVLGLGGAAKAVVYVLKKWNIPYQTVSRTAGKSDLLFEELQAGHIHRSQLIINTTPLGMAPAHDTLPIIPYDYLTPAHFLYDLVYNPSTTLFMEKGLQRGARVRNGLGMLHKQALKAWEFWNSPTG